MRASLVVSAHTRCPPNGLARSSLGYDLCQGRNPGPECLTAKTSFCRSGQAVSTTNIENRRFHVRHTSDVLRLRLLGQIEQ